MDYDKMELPEGDFIEKMLNKVRFGLTKNGCLVIDGSKPAKDPETNKIRYHTIRIKGKVLKTHRYAFEMYHGKEIPKGQIVRHKCDNPRCINPLHLELGTKADNARDMVERRRWKGNGDLKPLTDDEKIIAKFLLKEKTPEEVSEILRVSKTVIYQLANAFE